MRIHLRSLWEKKGARSLVASAMLGILLVFFVRGGLPFLFTAVEPIGTVLLQSADDYGVTMLFHQELTLRPWWDSGLYIYGQMYYNVVKWPLVLLSEAIPTASQCAFLLKAVSLGAAVAALLLLFLGLRRLVGSAGALVSVAILGASPTFQRLSRTVHPDSLQALWVALAIVAAIRFAVGERLRWILVAFAACGFAFATKYQGVLAVVACFTALFLRSREGSLPDPRWLPSWGIIRGLLLLAGGTAILAAVACTPRFVSESFIESGRRLPLLAQALLGKLRVLSAVAGFSMLAGACMPAAVVLRFLRPRAWLVARWIALGATVAVVAAFLVAPGTFFLLRFVKGIAGIMLTVKTGVQPDQLSDQNLAHSLTGGVATFSWIPLIHREIPAFATVLLAFAVSALGWRRWRPSVPATKVFVVSGVFVLVTLAQLMSSGYRTMGAQSHHALFVLVGLSIAGGAMASHVLAVLRGYGRQRLAPYALGVAFLASICAPAWVQSVALAKDGHARLHRSVGQLREMERSLKAAGVGEKNLSSHHAFVLLDPPGLCTDREFGKGHTLRLSQFDTLVLDTYEWSLYLPETMPEIPGLERAKKQAFAASPQLAAAFEAIYRPLGDPKGDFRLEKVWRLGEGAQCNYILLYRRATMGTAPPVTGGR